MQPVGQSWNIGKIKNNLKIKRIWLLIIEIKRIIGLRHGVRISEIIIKMEQKKHADEVFNKLEYQSSWITKEATESLVKYAETAGKFMAKNGLTNSKIRSIYGEIKRVQMGVFEKEKSSFYLL